MGSEAVRRGGLGIMLVQSNQFAAESDEKALYIWWYFKIIKNYFQIGVKFEYGLDYCCGSWSLLVGSTDIMQYNLSDTNN